MKVSRKLAACIETCPEEWSNRLMVTELWVHEKLRRKGIGHALMAVAKQQANLEHRREIILETQSCNVPAISFYLQEGFELIGFDSCCYSNRDIDKKEVRLDLGYFPRKNKVKKEDIIIREETEKFLGIELVEGGLSEFGGRFIEPKVFEELSEEENEEFTKCFSTSAKQKFPCQWD